MSAELDVLVAGYIGERVASTVSLIQDGDLLVVVDPGMVADRSAILGPLRARGIAPEAITDIVNGTFRKQDGLPRLFHGPRFFRGAPPFNPQQTPATPGNATA